MGWNTRHIKVANAANVKAMPVGLPVSVSPTYYGNYGSRGYKDAWDIERAYREGMKKVTWVFRAIDVIAGNQARLPIILRKDNSPWGETVSRDDLLEVLNQRANVGENAYIFRHRISAQLLMSTRGVFVEIIRGRGGKILALNLLPPQYTAPVPDPKKFVAGFEVMIPHMDPVIVPPEDVIWIRNPHPLDPYLSLTPLEAAGIAVEIENLAKFYNRNFLLNDGRPGGLIVVRGEIDEDDKEELRTRFQGNLNRAGQVSVLAADDGVDFVDTSATPRDAAYLEMRNITKEEILAAFGVPESVIGNAAGRTFSNAAEELRVFWMETMLPHLEILARSLDDLHPTHYVAFDTSSVPILILAKQEREKHHLDEFQGGLISANEYREATGRKKVESELADALLANPTLTPIGNTEKKMEFPDPAQAQEQMAQPGAPLDANPRAVIGQVEGDSEAVDTTAAPPSYSSLTTVNPEDLVAASAPSSEIQVKAWGEANPFEAKAAQAVQRWESILDLTLERFFDRQQRVVMEKARGAKTRKALAAGTLMVDSLFDGVNWNRQLEEDVRPVLAGIATEAALLVAESVGQTITTDALFAETIDAQMDRIKQINEKTKSEIAAAVLAASSLQGDEEERSLLLKTAIVAVFVTWLANRRSKIAEEEAQAAFNAGVYLAGESLNVRQKTWLTRMDDRVRHSHRLLHGKTVNLREPFEVEGAQIRFPGDPLAPLRLTIGCRCRLRFG